MLVLSRKQNEKIIVGDNVTITVLKIRGNTVRIGIDAPREVAVVRGELAVEQESRSAVEPVTVEFRSNGDCGQGNGPSLRIVGQEAEAEADDEGLASTGISRLQQLVAGIAANQCPAP
jgi:carbon storage regulator CsrA